MTYKLFVWELVPPRCPEMVFLLKFLRMLWDKYLLRCQAGRGVFILKDQESDERMEGDQRIKEKGKG